MTPLSFGLVLLSFKLGFGISCVFFNTELHLWICQGLAGMEKHMCATVQCELFVNCWIVQISEAYRDE